MSKMTATQYRDQIIDYHNERGQPISKSRAMKIGIRMHRKRDEIRDFEDGLRILGIITDVTPREAIRNMERQTA